MNCYCLTLKLTRCSNSTLYTRCYCVLLFDSQYKGDAVIGIIFSHILNSLVYLIERFNVDRVFCLIIRHYIKHGRLKGTSNVYVVRSELCEANIFPFSLSLYYGVIAVELKCKLISSKAVLGYLFGQTVCYLPCSCPMVHVQTVCYLPCSCPMVHVQTVCYLPCSGPMVHIQDPSVSPAPSSNFSTWSTRSNLLFQ